MVEAALGWASADTGDQTARQQASSQQASGSGAVRTDSAGADLLTRPSDPPTASAPSPVVPPQQPTGPTGAGATGSVARVVPESPPLRLEAPSIGLEAGVSAYTAADVRRNGGVVKPASLWDVSWWTGGGTPGTGSRNTVYLYGHTWKEPAVFNHLKDLESGDSVYLTTARGRLRYVVEGSFTVLKPQLPGREEVSAAVPGRLLLLACYRETGREQHTTRNIVVTAQLARPGS